MAGAELIASRRLLQALDRPRDTAAARRAVGGDLAKTRQDVRLAVRAHRTQRKMSRGSRVREPRHTEKALRMTFASIILSSRPK
jgi:hypothetical protein